MACLPCCLEVARGVFGSADHGPVVGVAEVEVGGDGLAAAPAGDHLAGCDPSGVATALTRELRSIAALLACPALPVSLGSVCRAEAAVGLGVNDGGATGTCANLHGTSS